MHKIRMCFCLSHRHACMTMGASFQTAVTNSVILVAWLINTFSLSSCSCSILNKHSLELALSRRHAW